MANKDPTLRGSATDGPLARDDPAPGSTMYYDHYTDKRGERIWGRKAGIRTPEQRRAERYCRRRKRDYVERIFRGALLQLRLDGAIRMAGAYRESIEVLQALSRDWSASTGTEAAQPAPTGDLANILQQLGLLKNRRSQVRALLGRYAALHQEMRSALRIAFLLQEQMRLQAERDEVVAEVDGRLHYSLHTLRSEVEILRQAGPQQESTPRWRLLPRDAASGTGVPAAPRRSKSLRPEARLIALEERRQRLLERRDDLHRNLLEVRRALQDLGVDPENAEQGRQIQTAVQAKEAEVRAALKEALDAERQTEARLRDFSAPLGEYLSSLAPRDGDARPVEDLLAGLFCFVGYPAGQPTADELSRLAQRVSDTIERVNALVGSEARTPPGTAETGALSSDLSLDPDIMLSAQLAREGQAPADRDSIHEAIRTWFASLQEHIEGVPEEPMGRFEELLLIAAPWFLRRPVSTEVRNFRQLHGEFQPGC